MFSAKNIIAYSRKKTRGEFASPPVGNRLKQRPDHGDDQRGQIIGDLDLLAEGEIHAHAEDQHIAHGGEIRQRSVRHQRTDEGGEHGHQPLPDGHGDHGEDRALAHGSSERHHDDHIQDALGGQDRVVVIERVVHGTDDRHRADADGEGGGGEAVDKAGITLGMALDFQPFTKALQIAFNIENLAQQAAQTHRDHQQHFAGGAQNAVGHGEHVLECAGCADENCAHAAGLDHDILIAVLKRLAEQEAQ